MQEEWRLQACQRVQFSRVGPSCSLRIAQLQSAHSSRSEELSGIGAVTLGSTRGNQTGCFCGLRSEQQVSFGPPRCASFILAAISEVTFVQHTREKEEERDCKYLRVARVLLAVAVLLD